MPISIGARLGPYEILAAIGTGGMGEVYRAKDPRLHRDVAIKVGGAQFAKRSEREARLVAALNHPNICHVYDVGPNYLVMELVEGPTLAERLHQGPLPLDEALDIARQIGEALEAAHEKGIVHRDLKPGNIKIKPDGTVKVLDFGLAKATDVDPPPPSTPENLATTLEHATSAGVVLGTPAYMAPEQARGKPVDKRADIWAFGVVLYEMLTGRRLFKGATVSDILAAVLTTEPDWNSVPPGTEVLLRRCLERDPKQRLRDIGDARFLLGASPRPAITAAAGSWPWKAGVGTLAVLLTGALASLWLLTRTTPASVLRLSVDLGEDAALSPHRGATMDLSPDGSQLVFIIGKQLVKSRLAMRRLDQPKALLLDGTDGVEAPFFSPDGKSIAFFADGKLKRMDAAGGVPITLCDAPSPRGGSWGDDGNIVFAATNLGGLSRIPANGGVPQLVTKLDPKRNEETHRYPQVLPGATAVLFMNTNASGEGTIEVQSLKTGERKTLVQEGAYGRYVPSRHLVFMHRGALFAAPMDAGSLELTGSPVPVLEDVGFYPGTGTAAFTFSQSGIFAYIAANPEDQLRSIGVMDEKGTVDLLPVAKGRYGHPRISPDGTRLAITVRSGSGPSVWIYEWGSRQFSRFSFVNGDSNNAIWTPDGKQLVFSSNTQERPGPGIYWMRADRTGAPLRLVEGAGLVPNFFSSDRTRLIYDVSEGPDAGLRMIPLDWSDAANPKPGTPERLPAPIREGPANFSSDERWIAYLHPLSGTPEVFVKPFPSSGGPWQISNGGNNPFWSRTARELFYRSLPDSRIMVVSYSVAGDSFIPGRPRRFADTRVESYDLMPDGKHVVMIPAAEQKEATHATFLLNFMDDLRRRVQPGK